MVDIFQKGDCLTKGGMQKMIFISEANLYKTIFQSRKESAERFTDCMDTVIALCVSVVGSYFCGVDFCTLYALISISIELNKYAKDKTANR